MAHQYVEVSDAPGCFSQLKDSIAKVGIGFVMILISFPLLFWNEGRAVKRAQDLEFGRGAVESVSADKVAPDGKLVHVTGKVVANKPATDKKFGVVAEGAIGLERKVEMFQWKENKETKKDGDKNITTYTYVESWESSAVSSSNFKKPGYDNPPFPNFESKSFQAEDVSLGKFKVSADLTKKWPVGDSFNVPESTLSAFGQVNGRSASLNNGSVYFGDSGSPIVGDVRVTYTVGNGGDGSMVSGVQSGSLVPYSNPEMNGTIGLVQTGTQSADAMFQAAEDANVMMTWILRLVGFFLMFAGFNLLFGPIDTIIRKIPLIGGVIDFGTTVIAGLLAFALSFITIAIGWIFYRPLIGILLLLVGFGAIGAMIFLAMKAKKK